VLVCVQIIGIGYAFDYPPAGLPGMTRFMDSLNIPEISEVRVAAEPLVVPAALPPSAQCMVAACRLCPWSAVHDARH